HPVRALCTGPGPMHGVDRRTWPAADRYRRLERRHEPGGASWPRRERMAWLAASSCRRHVRAYGTRTRPGPRGALATACRAPARRYRDACLGWGVVSARDLRRWHLAG